MASTGLHRRQLLRAVGAAAAAPVAGCGYAGGSTRSSPVTPAPVPTDTPTTTPPPSPVPPTAGDFEFDVRTLQPFTAVGPGRLEIAFRNVGDQVLTGVGERQFVLPFVDDDYTGVDGSGRSSLFLAPDDSTLRVEPEGSDGGWLGEALPDEPVDGCWTLPFEWPAARGLHPAVLRTASVPPDGEITHTYGVYFVDACRAATVTFEHTFGLATGAALVDAQVRPTRLGFDLSIGVDGGIDVAVHDPVVGQP